MGNAQVMTAKISWDNACYWAISALLFFQRRYRRPEFIESIDPLMRRFFVLHARMQSFLREWDLLDTGARYSHSSHNVVSVDFLRQLQAKLGDPVMDDDDALRARLEDNYALLERFARSWQAIAAERYPAIARFVAPAEPGEVPLDLGLLRPTRSDSAIQRAQDDRRVVTAEP
jgi:hypothetical protein